MKRRLVSVVTVAVVMATMMVGSALPAIAAHSQGQGTPNEKACQGVVIGGLAHSKNPQGPFTPPKVAESRGDSVREYTESVREGEIGVRSPTGETVFCPED